MLTGHGIHEFPFGELALEHIAIGKDDVELQHVSGGWRGLKEVSPTHLLCFSLPSLLYPGGSDTREDITARADLVKKF
jgi:hypothetical protein